MPSPLSPHCAKMWHSRWVQSPRPSRSQPARLCSRTQTSSLQNLVGERSINSLPLNGRNVTFLAQTAPGITFAQADSRGLSASGSLQCKWRAPRTERLSARRHRQQCRDCGLRKPDAVRHHASAGCPAGVRRADQQLLGGVRPLRGRCIECVFEVRWRFVPWRRMGVHSQRRAGCA